MEWGCAQGESTWFCQVGIRGGSLEEAGVRELDAGGQEGASPRDRERGCARWPEVLKGWWVWRPERNPVTRVQVGRECEGERTWRQAGPICQPAKALLCLSGKAI